MAGTRLTARLGLADTDLDNRGYRVQTATGKVETLKGGLTREAVPVVLNAGTANELCLLEQLAPTESTGYDLLIGTRVAYPSGLLVVTGGRRKEFTASIGGQGVNRSGRCQ